MIMIIIIIIMMMMMMMMMIIIIIIIIGTFSRTDTFCAYPRFKRPFVLGLNSSLD